jgi:hypothetical protein
MRRSILAIGLALLLSFTTVIRPVSAADMPVKAPPPPAPVVAEFCWLCLLVLIPIGLCIAFCDDDDDRPAVSPGAPGRR